MINNYASFWRRLFAYFVDQLIIGLVAFSLVGGFAFTIHNGSSSSSGFLSIPIVILAIFYYAHFWSTPDGQTIGNRLLAIKVTKEDGSRLSFGDGVVRYFGYILSGIVLCLGFIWIIFDAKKQGWHDKLAKTVVVKTDGKPKTLAVVAILGCGCIVPLIATIVAFGVAGVGISSLLKNDPQALRKIFSEASKKSEQESGAYNFTQPQANAFAQEMFDAANTYRTNHKLTAWKEDPRLCAYATRRLEQITALGQYDDGKGFYEDNANPQIISAYFSDFRQNGEFASNIIGINSSQEYRMQQVTSNWKPENTDQTVNSIIYDYACARASTDYLLFAVAKHK